MLLYGGGGTISTDLDHCQFGVPLGYCVIRQEGTLQKGKRMCFAVLGRPLVYVQKLLPVVQCIVDPKTAKGQTLLLALETF